MPPLHKSSSGDITAAESKQDANPTSSSPAEEPSHDPAEAPSTGPAEKPSTSWDVSAADSAADSAVLVTTTAPVAKPTKPLTVGLINEGCTCYLNSLLQLLFHTNYFRTAVYRIPPETEAGAPQATLCEALQELFFEMQERTTPASTRALTTAFGWGEEELMVQHDIQEMATLLRDALEEKMKGTESEGTIHQLFEGRAEQVVETLDRSYASRKPDVFYDIHLPLTNHQTLMDSLRSLTAKDQLVGDNKYRVEEEGKPPVYKDAERGFRFCRFAPVTWFHLKRFDMDLTSPTLEMKKVNSVLEFPLVLDLQELEEAETAADDDRPASPASPKSPLRTASPAIYDLQGVIVHRGTVNSGHYYCYIRAWDAERQAFTHWVEYDDDTVRVVSEEVAVAGNFGGAPGTGRQRLGGDSRANRASAYVLSYVRRAAAPTLLAPCPTDVITQSVKDALRKNMKEEERRLRQAEAAREQLTVYVLTEASLSACVLDLQAALLPPDLTKLRRYAEATLELKKHDPLQLAYEQLDELLLTPCGFPLSSCRLWHIAGGAPLPPTHPGRGLLYTAPSAGYASGADGGATAAGSTGGAGRSSLHTRELHVGPALPTWRECSEHGSQDELLLYHLLSPAERQKSSFLGLYLQGPLLPTGPPDSVPSASAAAAPSEAAALTLSLGTVPLVRSMSMTSSNAVVEAILSTPTPLTGITAVLAPTATGVHACTMTVQFYDDEAVAVGRYQETIVVNVEDMRVVWKLGKADATPQDQKLTEKSSPKVKPTTAPFKGPVTSVKFQVTNTHTGKPLLILDAHVHVSARHLQLHPDVSRMTLVEPGHDRILVFVKLFDHGLGSVRYIGHAVLDRALTPRHCEDWLLRRAGAEHPYLASAPDPTASRPPLRLRFFEESRGCVIRELHPDKDWMENHMNTGTTIVVQRALIAPLYRHIHVESFYHTLRFKELVRMVEVVPTQLDVECAYAAQLKHFAALRQSLPAREAALASAVQAYQTYVRGERERRMVEMARATGPATTGPATTAAASSSTRQAQTAPRIEVDVTLNPFSSFLPVLRQTELRVARQAMCAMLLTWNYESVCDALADTFMASPGAIRLYASADSAGSHPQRAPAPTSATLKDMLRLDTYTTTNTLFFETLDVPRAIAEQHATFNVTLRDAEGHALHCERFSLGREECTRQGLVRAVRQAVQQSEADGTTADPWGTLASTLAAPQYTLLVVAEEDHVIQLIKEVRLTGRDGAPHRPENALDWDWQGRHLVLIPLGPLPRGAERIACCHGEYRNGELTTFGNPFVITVHEATTVTQAMEAMLACTHVPVEALHRDSHYAIMMMTERACYFSDWEETIVMYWHCTQNTSDHVPSLVLNYSNPLDKPGSRYVAHSDQRLKITK